MTITCNYMLSDYGFPAPAAAAAANHFRLSCPWDSPSKNTGMGCHFLLQCMKVKSESEVNQWSLTHSDPMDCSPPGSSVRGIFQAIVLEWGAIALSSKGTGKCYLLTIGNGESCFTFSLSSCTQERKCFL